MRRVLIVDDDPHLRGLVSAALRQAGFDTLDAASGAAALASARRDEPDLVVLDVFLPDISGYELCRELRDEFGERVRILFVSGERVHPTDRAAGLLIGADDYVTKPFAPDELVARARALVRRSAPRASAPRRALTPRELEVLALVAEGLTNRAIGERLFISDKTASVHVSNILAKLGVSSRTEAAAVAHREGLTDLASA